MDCCPRLEMFPPIVGMKNLETLTLSLCYRLRKFPEILGHMDRLVNLRLDGSGIEVVPSSIGQYCTNLVSLSLFRCSHLISIEVNFHLLKHLKVLQLNSCKRFEKLPKDLFGVECCLKELSLPPKRQSPSSKKLFKNLMSCMGLQFFHRDLVVLEFPHLPRFLRKLDLRRCNLVDGDIPSDIGELSNLQELYLGLNEFSRLHSSLSQLPRLKLLDLSYCQRLVELPELPPSIAVLEAVQRDSLETVGDLTTNCKWLWKVSLLRWNNKGALDGERLLQFMLQGNAIENHFFSLFLPGHEIPMGFVLVKGNTFTLWLPQNWDKDFSGFLICTATMGYYGQSTKIIMKQKMGMDSQSELWQESNETPVAGLDANMWMGYVSFSSLRNTRWWNSAYSTISFSLFSESYKAKDVISGSGVGLVPRKSKGDPRETTRAATDLSEFWDNNSRKTFGIQHDSKSALEILWCP